jgi:hypothetical protein
MTWLASKITHGKKSGKSKNISRIVSFTVPYFSIYCRKRTKILEK